MDADLVGAWVSTEAFGNTSLDWSEDVKAGKAVLHLTFTEEGSVQFDVQGPRTYAHVLPAETLHCTAKDGLISIPGDASGLAWNYRIEDVDALQLRLVGAKRFARCKEVVDMDSKDTLQASGLDFPRQFHAWSFKTYGITNPSGTPPPKQRLQKHAHGSEGFVYSSYEGPCEVQIDAIQICCEFQNDNSNHVANGMWPTWSNAKERAS